MSRGATHLLFLCSRNRLRSPTAERVFADWPGIETASAGLAADADEPLTRYCHPRIREANIGDAALPPRPARTADRLSRAKCRVRPSLAPDRRKRRPGLARAWSAPSPITPSAFRG